MFKLIKRKKIYKDQWLTFFQDEIKLPDGSQGTYSWTDRKNGVGIVVVTTDNRILLNYEYRYVISKYSWEIPGGGIDEGEKPEDAAARELYEETGIKANKLNKIGVFYPLNSFNTENITYFYTIIEPTSITATKTESGEDVTQQKYVSFSDVLKMIDEGEIDDAPTANTVQILIRKLQKNNPK